jgi:hypothetical protein
MKVTIVMNIHSLSEMASVLSHLNTHMIEVDYLELNRNPKLNPPPPPPPSKLKQSSRKR